MKLDIYGGSEGGSVHFSAHGENTEEELLACPFCGGQEISVCNTHTPYYQAECLACGAEGPRSQGPSRVATKTRRSVKLQHETAFLSAVSRWNARA